MKKRGLNLSTTSAGRAAIADLAEGEIQQNEDEARGDADQPLIRIERLTKTFREGSETRKVLDSLSATIQAGEFIAIQGKSGSGKSTLLNLISGIDVPNEGKVFINGIDLTGLTERDRTLFRRRHIGIVFQFFNLIPTLTVWENVSLPLELNGTVSSDQSKYARQLLDRVGLDDRRSAFPDRLSGGEQQRVAIARALVNDPALILADEPTGNLDAETSQAVLDLLESLARQAGKTLVMVTHSRSAAANADRLLTLQRGKLEIPDGALPPRLDAPTELKSLRS